jgi:5'-methylthioadenosine phosphorylase
VSVNAVLEIIRKNVSLAREIVKRAAERIPAERPCECAHAAEHAVMTDRALVPAATRERVQLLFGKYLPSASGGK